MTTQTLRQSWFVQRSPIFYGWVVWFAGMVGLISTAPGQSFSVSLFIDHYIVDFGLDRSSVSALYGLGTFTAALSLTWVGKRIDRHGNRFMSVVIVLLFAVALMACSQVNGPLTILLSFVAIRGLGQGSLGLVSSTAIAQWFQKRRGRVMGFALIGFALFQRFYLPLLQSYIDDHGWRAAWLLLGGMMLLIAPFLGLLLRDRPEDFGLEPDGEASSLTSGTDKLIQEYGLEGNKGKVVENSDAATFAEDNWELNEAIRTPIFWAFTFARMLSGAWGTALVFHQVSIFENLGYEAIVAAETYGQIALMTAGIVLMSGWLVDRIRPNYLIVIQMMGLASASTLAMFMTEEWMLPLYAMSFGIAMGMGSVFDGTVWANIYGRKNQGAIRGFVATALVIGTSIGPLVFGLAYDNLGNYDVSMWMGVGLAAMAIAFALMAKKPVRAVTT